ncbi:tyrosine-protein phosphatase non-receptor type 23 isoform X2 [Toxorhynchites rutilus septentrionalis]|uniref:tyrosine-protein phosphatase non-receptor type 23 isoform X2 n=1 Tax=Toxorhynchites rutilus septentrionalis TaxID=329112 RepID=UPI00247A4970|nr:tyrosine-protein phosphatase non-receptor type 23 isoform X2 [Toxorhynchites rutilus septentrionalis]
MEAVPRMPMVSFELKVCPDATSFGPLKQYIAEYYHEDPDSYSKECYQLEQLRSSAARPSQDVEGTAVLKRYYCQLHSIQNRFLLNQLPESHQMLTFSWRDLYSGSTLQKSNVKFEMAVILHNFGALHTQLGAAEGRADPESMKKACTHFQCAAWAFGYIKDNFALLLQGDLSTELLVFMQALCFAQAQECIMEKSLCDNRKSGIIAKVTAQIVTYYNSALAALLVQNGEDGRIQDIVGGKQFKEWRKYVKFKISYLSCILLLYQGQQSEEQQKMGERVILYQSSFDKLEEARKESKGLAHIDQVNDALQFTMDVVEAKRKSAKNENEFIYHEEVPDISSIAAVQGANLVHGIAFNVTDTDAMGDDIFHRLVPMKAHESSSVYSEEKANLLRTIGTKVEDKDSELTTFMSSLNLDSIHFQNPNSIGGDNRLPQGLVDRCADLNAKPNAIPDLVQSMSNLAETCSDVELMLREIKHLLKQDEIQEDSYQQKIGQRSNGGGHVAELNREYAKYQEAHNKAGESNDTLRKAMGLHVHNLKILAQPLKEIKEQIPTCGEQFDESTLKELQGMLAKVNEMKSQRVKLYQDLRTNITNDDITSQVIALEGGPDNKQRMQELFEKELAKHNQLITLLEANMKAQANILKVLTDIYARCAPIIKSISETKYKREQFFSSLQGSYDVYEDLLSKSAKGLEFYKKLQANVQKLYSRVKAACDVQDEERNQKLKSSNMVKKQDSSRESPRMSSGPKLKDYLKSGNITLGSIKAAGMDTNPSAYIPPVRPNPVGSESTAPTSSANSTAGGYYQDSYSSSNYYPATAMAQSTQGVTDYTQYYQHHHQQQQQMSYGQPATSSTFQSNTNPTMTSTQTQPQTTGYVNPIYQNPTHSYYNNNRAVDYNQYPPSQPSPALSSVSGDAPPTQQWNQMTQQFGSMNLYQPTANYQTNLDTNTALNYNQINSYKTDATSLNQQYSTQANQSHASFGQSSAQYQAASGQYYQQPQTQVHQQYTQPTQPSEPQKTNPDPSNSYPTYPGYSYNPQTGTYEYTGVQYNQSAQPPQVNPYDSSKTVPPTTNTFSIPAPASTSGGSYYQQQVADYSNQQQTQTQYMNPYSSSSVAQGTITQSIASNIPSSQTTTTAGYNGYGGQATQLQDVNQQYQPGQTQNSYYNNTPGYAYQQSTPAVQYPQPTVDTNSVQNQYSNYGVTSYNYGTYSATNADGSATQQPPPAAVQPTIDRTTKVTVPSASQPQQAPPSAPAPAARQSSNLDLLSGIDFTPAPVEAPVLQPQSSVTSKDEDVKSEVLTPTKVVASLADVTPNPASVAVNQQPQTDTPALGPPAGSDRKASVDNLSICSDLSSIDQNFDWESASLHAGKPTQARPPQIDPIGSIVGGGSTVVLGTSNRSTLDNILVQPVRDPFEDQSTLKWFHKEVERLEKFIDSLNVKTLNGTTPLDGKWKELQDLLVKEEAKRQVSVARLFPEKNRSVDCVPYDHARVTLPTETDNYINAAYVKDLGFGCPQLVLAQTPLQNTVNDFWNMIWSQKANVVVCLHTPNEILDTFWPLEIKQELTYGDVSVSLIKQFDLTHCIERMLRVTMLGSDIILNVSLLQNKLWLKQSAEYVLGIAQNVIDAYRQQQSQELKSLKPLIVNCLNGSDRSSLLAVAIASILATQTKKPILINIVDIWYRICCQRKGALRDPSHIQQSYQIVLSNGHSILNKRGIMTSYQMKTEQASAAAEKEEAINDPFKDLDPLWKLK